MLTLLCSYFSSRLPCCALICLRTNGSAQQDKCAQKNLGHSRVSEKRDNGIAVYCTEYLSAHENKIRAAGSAKSRIMGQQGVRTNKKKGSAG